MDEQTLKLVTAFITGVGLAVTGLNIFIAWTNYKRTRNIDGTRLFWDLRKDAISEQHREYMKEMVQLLVVENLESGEIQPTPAINRALNHLEWVGFFVREGVISEAQASSTFGNEIIHLYPVLFDYIRKRRIEEGYRSLWENVDYLYQQLAKYAEKHHNYGFQPEREIQKMEKFMAKYRKTEAEIRKFCDRVSRSD